MKYKEIFRLKDMLESENIQFSFIEQMSHGYQIAYPDNGYDRVCSVIENKHSYGNKKDLLEIQGLLTDEEKKNDDVCGWLTAEEVFNRIKQHYEGGDQE